MTPSFPALSLDRLVEVTGLTVVWRGPTVTPGPGHSCSPQHDFFPWAELTKREVGAGGVAQVIEWLPNKHEALSLNPSAAEKIEKSKNVEK
jgi:hypothetical protein